MKDNADQAFTTDELHAYADGKLSLKRKGQIEKFLASHPDAAAEVVDYQRINSAIYETFSDSLNPGEIIDPVSLQRDWLPRRAASMMAVAATLFIGIGLGWFSHGLTTSANTAHEQLAKRSSAAYVVYSPEKLHPVEVHATDARYLSSWFSARMDMSFRIPKLGDLGFELVGGRLMIGETSPAALLMYENDNGRRIVLYIRNDLPKPEATKMQYERIEKTGVVTWADGTTGFGLAGGLTENDLLSAAHVVRAQFS